MNTTSVLAYIVAAASAVLALAAAFRAGRSAARWSFVIGMLLLAAENALLAACIGSHSEDDIKRWQTWRMLVTATLIAPWWIFSCIYARGDVARFFRRRYGYIALLVLVPVAALLLRDELIASVGLAAGSGNWVVRLGWAGFLLYVVLVLGAVAILMNLERVFRASVGTMRWRIKFAVLAVGVLFITRIYTCSEILLFRGLNLTIETANVGAVLIAIPLIIWSYKRSGHLELDVYPSGPALKNSLTVIVAGVYLLVVGALAKTVSFLGGEAAFAIKALLVLVALVVLAIGLQSDRFQFQLRRFVSRHFQRPLHDYRAVWKKFTEGTASRLDPPDLCRSLASLIAEVFEALSVRIWLLNDKRDLLTLTASTTQGPGAAVTTNEDSIEATALIGHFETHPEPVDIDESGAPWCSVLRACHPSDFANGGHRVCVPLFVHRELVGVITLGDRVNGTPFSSEDIELLKCIADHAAASLLNLHLSQRVMQAKQLEAFQSMAAFFVHDLKNAASTLSLMLKNLPVHFDDPEFRADALRGIGKTVDHINGLVGRLTALRHELKVDPKEADLNEIVTQALSGLNNLPRSTVEKDMQPVPRIPIDREQVHKVITNLVLNAAEAVADNGKVRISTSQENGWVVLTVDDNGCGMSEDFMRSQLFRPFQTTKKNGMGIGMFQSKMIIEAHGGRIAVSSQPGHGTRFQVYLRTTAAGA